MNELEVHRTVTGPISQEDLVELGAQLTGSGLTTLESRAFVTQVQQAASQVALNMAPELLEQVRRINSSRIITIMQQIRALPTLGGYVSRDRVLQIVQDAYITPPRN